MPTYSYHCDSCDKQFDEIAALAEYQAPQPCSICGESSRRVMGRLPAFILQGDGWPGKNLRIRDQMNRKNRHLAGKEREFKSDGGIPQLVPNVAGEQTESWSDATKLARDRGKDTSGYEAYARKEGA